MRILQICNRIPWPIRDGGAFASFVINQSVQQFAEVKLLAIETPENIKDKAKVLGPWNETNLIAGTIDTRPTKTRAAANLFSKLPFHVSRFYNQELAQKCMHLLIEFKPEVVIFEAPQTTRFLPIVKRYSKAKIFLRAHNIEHHIWERVAETTSSKILKAYLKLQNNKLKQYELELISKLDGVLTLSDADTNWFINNGMAKDKVLQVYPGLLTFPEKPEPNLPSAAYLGSLNWLPNRESVLWLKNEVWPIFKKLVKNPTLTVAGKDMPKNWISSNQDGLHFIGEVENAVNFWKNHGICLVPLLAGSGIRVRIIEAMALGKVVISTSMGVIGLPKPLPGVIIADSPQEFADAWHYLCTNNDEREKLSVDAYLYAKTHFDAIKGAKSIVSFFNNLPA